MAGLKQATAPAIAYHLKMTMWTIGQVAKKYALSRSALIYYDKLGVLTPGGRSASNYRLYTEGDLKKLERIMLFRSTGLSLDTIASLLGRGGGELAGVLESRLADLNGEIQALRNQQKVILDLLSSKGMAQKARVLTKQVWVSILRGAGLDEAGMRQWHIQFEKTSPEAHQDFLESIGIGAAEIRQIRAWKDSPAS